MDRHGGRRSDDLGHQVAGLSGACRRHALKDLDQAASDHRCDREPQSDTWEATLARPWPPDGCEEETQCGGEVGNGVTHFVSAREQRRTWWSGSETEP
jgi:hypothetical protein